MNSVSARCILSYRHNMCLCSIQDPEKFVNEVQFGFIRMEAYVGSQREKKL